MNKIFKVFCEKCNGTGQIPDDDEPDYEFYECRNCDGKGWIMAYGDYEVVRNPKEEKL